MRNARHVALGAILLAAVLNTSSHLHAQSGPLARRQVVSGQLHKNFGDHGGEAPYVIVDPESQGVLYEVTADSTVDLAEWDKQQVRLHGDVTPGLGDAAARLTVVGVNAAPASQPDRAIAQVQGEIVYGDLGPGEVVYEEGGYAGGEMIDGGVMYEGGPVYDQGYGPAAQPPLLAPLPLLGLYPSTPPQGTSFGAPHWYWVRAEYLSWWTSGMDLPALVTTSPAGTTQTEAGVLGTSGVETLFGGQEYHEDPRSGGRIRFGLWLDPMAKLGIEGEYFGLEQTSEHFAATSVAGSPILARPFYNVLNFAEDSELVGFPNLVDGTVSVDTRSDFESAAARARWTLCCAAGACDMCDPCAGCVSTGPGINLVAGYRYFRLDEGVHINEDLNSLSTAAPGTFDINDVFDTQNRFHGGELGMLVEWRRRRWFLEALARVSLGVNEQSATIRGDTMTSVLGIDANSTGGILAQRSNIGEFNREQFTAIPEIGVTLGWNVTPRLACTLGYNFIYWAHVVRPGDVMNLELNPNLFPPEVDPLVGPLKPEFAWNDSDFWAQGLSAGVDYRW